MSQWTTIESDPGVFHELIHKFGVKGLQVEELWSMDKEALEPLSPVFGLVFLFKWTPEKDERPVAQDTTGRVFFANQVIQDACATQAILSVLMNIDTARHGAVMQLGPELASFKDFTAELPPDMKGLAISNSDAIRDAHNSFSRPEPLIPDDDHKGGEKEDAFHFVAYVPVGGTLYELDGLKPGPIALCDCSEENWTERVGPHIQARIERYAASEIRFNLMAICGDKEEALARKLEARSALRDAALARISSGAEAGAMQVDGAEQLPSDPGALQAKALELEGEIESLKDDLQSERLKRKRWHEENVRRRTNYLPLMFGLLRHAAEQGQLGALIASAKDPASKQARTEARS